MNGRDEDIAKLKIDEAQRLAHYKDIVRKSHDYFNANYERFNEFRRFIFEESLSADDKSILSTISFPQLEFNITEAFISRQLGEFAKQEPDVEVHAENPDQLNPDTIKLVDHHLRHVLSDYKNHHTKYEVYKDILSGGFSAFKVYTKYASPLSMKQEICIERVYEPTLCGWDPIARYSHKGDGKFCFELFPMSKTTFKEEHPHINVDKLSFAQNVAGFNWSYINSGEPIVIVCDFYEKRTVQKRIVELVDGRVMTLSRYKKMVKNWGANLGESLLPPPAIVGKSRKTEFTKIHRLRFMESTIILEEETDYTDLPLVFVDGNSALIKDHDNSNIRQVTRPFVYHLKGAQKLKNFAGNSLANEVENQVQHKFAIAKEALPLEQDFYTALKDIQKQNVVVFNAFCQDNPQVAIPNAFSALQRIPAPPEILQAFQGTDALMQMILGSYDASMGINNNQLSGRAIEIGALQSNAASMPYIVGFMNGLQRAAQIYVNLLPKYYITPRTLPLRDEEGKRYYIEINQDRKKPTFDYDDNALNVIVNATTSFSVQKSKSLMIIKEIMGMSPQFEQFMAQKGLKFILDNIEMRGIEELKSEVQEWTAQQEAQQKQMQATQAQMMQQQMMQNPVMMKNQIEQQKLQLDEQKMQNEMQLEQMKLQQEDERLHADLAIAHHKNATDLLKSHDQLTLEKEKIKLAHYEKQMELKMKQNKQNNLTKKDNDHAKTH